MNFLISLFVLITSGANAAPTDIHCKNEKLKASLSQVNSETFFLRVESLDNKSFSPQAFPDWRGFSVIFNKDECHSHYCTFKEGKHMFSAWDSSGSYFDLVPPVALRLLFSYRFHFESTFDFNGQKLDVNIQDGFATNNCLEPF